MQTPAPGGGGSMPAGLHAVQVWRCAPGTSAFLRCLSPSIGGLFTHFFKGRSVLCNDAECPSERHKLQRDFKGYLAAERWIIEKGIWLPCVLEMPHRLDQDLRPVYERGQVWEIARAHEPKGKKCPAIGRLLEQLDPLTLPSAFDIRAVLCNLYRCTEISLGNVNPMPPRLVLPPSDGRPPAKLEKKKSDAAPPEEQAAFRRKLREQGFLRDGTP